MRSTATIIGALLAATLLAAGSGAEEKRPYARADQSWISLSGTVDAVSPDLFTLDYGSGLVTVEMDDGDRDADAYALVKGDQVTVNGMIDDDFFETTTIEARSVYVEKLGTFFYASAADEEDPEFLRATPVVPSAVTVQGTVGRVEDGAFVLADGVRNLRVTVDQMAYDPLDDEGYQKVGEGDVVRVHGTMKDSDLFDARTLVAGAVTKLVR